MTKYKHQRRVRIELCLPVIVDLIVGTDEEPDARADWQIVAIRDALCDATPRMIGENADDADFQYLAEQAAKAKDIS